MICSKAAGVYLKLTWNRIDILCIKVYIPIHPVPLNEGRLAIVTSRGAGCGGRGSVRPAVSVRAQARSEAHSLYKGCVRTPAKREAANHRLTTTLRGADRGGDSPHLHRLCASAQVVWSLTESGPPLPAPDRAQVTYRGDDGVSPRALPGRARSKPKNPLRAERRMCPVLSW